MSFRLLLHISKRFVSQKPSSFYHFPNISSVCIIGGGVAGLQTARALQRIGIKHIKIIESQKEFGGVWKANKYENVGLQTPLKFYQFPEYLYKEHQMLSNSNTSINTKLSDYATSDILLEYITGYADKYNLYQYAEFNTKMTKLSKSLDPITGVHIGWNVTMSDNDTQSEKTEEYDFVVIAKGMFNKPSTMYSNIENIDAFRLNGGITIHSSQFEPDAFNTDNDKNDGDLNCVVVGAGKSAYDIADAAISDYRFKKPIKMIQRESQWIVPTKVANILPFQYVVYSKFAYYTFYPGYVFAAKHKKFMNNPIFKFLINKVYWKIVEKVFAAQFNRKRDEIPKSDILHDVYLGGIIMDAKKYREQIKNGNLEIICNDEIYKYNEKRKQFQLKSDKYIECDVLCSATGFKKEYNYFDKQDLNKLNFSADGLYLYQHIIPPKLERIAFIGCEVSTFQNIVTHFLQSIWLALNIKKQMEINKDEMKYHIDRNKIYKRSFMPNVSHRGSQIQVHLFGYHETLCRSINVDKHIKSNPISRWFAPYSAEDYARIIQQIK